MTVQLEQLLTHPQAFGLVTATKVQRAVCRVIDGLPLGVLAQDEAVIRSFGGPDAIRRLAAMVGTRPREVLILSGVRGGKSLLCAVLAVRASQTCDVSKLGPGDIPRVSVLSIDRDKAQAVFDHLKFNLMAQPALKQLLLEEPGADSLMLRHPSGKPIEVKVVAGKSAGAATVSRWSAGVIFDEAPRMVGEDEGVVNLDETARASRSRLLDGAQMVYPGSPWAPFGPIYDWTQEHFGKPSEDIVVVRARAYDLNPVWWTKQRCESLKRRDPDAYKVDVDAEFAMAESNMFSDHMVRDSTREAPLVLAPEPGAQYVAAMDPATRSNAWTLVVATRGEGMRRVALGHQWVGSRSAPLSPEKVLAEAAMLLKPYAVAYCETDQWAADANKDIARRYGLELTCRPATRTENVDMYTSLQARMLAGEVELPPDPVIGADLRSVKKRVTPDGVKIVLPKQSSGRHCDYAPALARALARYLDDPSVDERETDEDKMIRQHMARIRRDEDGMLHGPEEDLSDLVDFD